MGDNSHGDNSEVAICRYERPYNVIYPWHDRARMDLKLGFLVLMVYVIVMFCMINMFFICFI
jgi:hypothetical protein